jgi:predicted metal-dependent hydrolase
LSSLLRLTVSQSQKLSVVVVDNRLVVTSPAEDDQVVRPILETWYRSQAKKHFETRLPLLADLVDRDVQRVSIRSQRSRWGSCSSRKTISLNWRLIMAPDWVSDYVIYHELAHLTHMNHSPRFWHLLNSYHNEVKEAEKWLRDHHKLLEF